jgi:hypothetical protein
MLWFIFLEELEKTGVFICSTSSIEGGEPQMKKGDKRMNVLGLVVILVIIVPVFGGAVSAEDLSEVTQSDADAEI